MLKKSVVGIAACLAMGGCVSVDLSDVADGASAEGILFYDPVPFLVVTTNRDCGITATMVMMPDTSRLRSARINSGLAGQANLQFTNGMVGAMTEQNTVSIPDMIFRLSTLPASNGLTGRTGCNASVRYVPWNSDEPFSHTQQPVSNDILL